MKEIKKKGIIRLKFKNGEPSIFLETLKKNKLLPLRRLEWEGEPPDDPELVALIGRAIEVDGVKQGKTILMTSWRLII